MQTKDLTVGTDYAYDADYRSKRYTSRPDRVTVLAVGVRAFDADARGRSREHKQPGMVKVRYVNGPSKGTTFHVRPATLTKTWSQHHGERVSAGRAQSERERMQDERRAERASLALRLHDALVLKGAKVGISYTYDDDDYAALVTAGFKPVGEVEDIYGTSHLHSAVNGLSDLMRNGTVSLQHVAVLLGAQAPSEPEDSLDGYDLDEEE